MRRQPLLLAALGLMTLWRLALLPTVEFSPEEAFVAMRATQPWSADFSLHGPLLVWISRVTLMVGGPDTWGVRLAAPFLALITSLLTWHLARRTFDAAIAGWAVVVLNVFPAFNLAAVSWTPATLLFPVTAGLALAIHSLSQLPAQLPVARARRQQAWVMLGVGACVAPLATPAAWLPLGLGLLFFSLRSGLPRSVLRERGFWLACGLALLPAILWLHWQQAHHWPSLEPSRWLPDGRLIPGWFRWLVLTSPLLLTLLFWTLFAQGLHRKNVPAGSLALKPLLLGVGLPLALGDLLWHADSPWPDTGLASWQLLAAVLLAHPLMVNPLLQTVDRVSWRTISLLLAALQCVFLLNSDFARATGLPWAFEQRLDRSSSPWLHLLSRDPAGSQRGWQPSGRLVADVLIDTQLRSPQEGRYFVVASHWRLAAALHQALPADAPCLWPGPDYPRVHAPQDPMDWSHPFAHLPRYDARQPDGSSAFAGRDALYVSDDPTRRSPPAGIRAAFARTELLSVAQVMHAGQPVRELKIFACYTYRPPQL